MIQSPWRLSPSRSPPESHGPSPAVTAEGTPGSAGVSARHSIVCPPGRARRGCGGGRRQTLPTRGVNALLPRWRVWCASGRCSLPARTRVTPAQASFLPRSDRCHCPTGLCDQESAQHSGQARSSGPPGRPLPGPREGGPADRAAHTRPSPAGRALGSRPRGFGPAVATLRSAGCALQVPRFPAGFLRGPRCCPPSTRLGTVLPPLEALCGFSLIILKQAMCSPRGRLPVPLSSTSAPGSVAGAASVPPRGRGRAAPRRGWEAGPQQLQASQGWGGRTSAGRALHLLSGSRTEWSGPRNRSSFYWRVFLTITLCS